MDPFPKCINYKITILIKWRNEKDEKIIEIYRIEIMITKLHINKNNAQVNKKKEEGIDEEGVGK